MRWSRAEYVVDASVGIKLFVDEPNSDDAIALFTQLTAEPPGRLYVPDLFYVECANVLWKYVRRSRYPAEEAAQAIQNLGSLNLASLPTHHLIADALRIAIEYNVTAYDACYVALAHALNVPLVTADERLSLVMRDTVYRIEVLGSPSLL